MARSLSDKWAVAVEEYADVGTLRRFNPGREESHQIFGVFDHHGKSVDIEAGVGFGITGASDRVTLKLILSHDFNPRKKGNVP